MIVVPHNSGRVLCYHVGHPCVCPSICRTSFHILCPNGNFRKCQWIFTKLDVCIDSAEIWSGLLIGKFHQFLTELPVCDKIMAGYYHFTLFILPSTGVIYMNCQSLFSGKNKKKISIFHLLNLSREW